MNIYLFIYWFISFISHKKIIKFVNVNIKIQLNLLGNEPRNHSFDTSVHTAGPPPPCSMESPISTNFDPNHNTKEKCDIECETEEPNCAYWYVFLFIICIYLFYIHLCSNWIVLCLILSIFYTFTNCYFLLFNFLNSLNFCFRSGLCVFDAI